MTTSLRMEASTTLDTTQHSSRGDIMEWEARAARARVWRGKLRRGRAR